MIVCTRACTCLCADTYFIPSFSLCHYRVLCLCVLVYVQTHLLFPLSLCVIIERYEGQQESDRRGAEERDRESDGKRKSEESMGNIKLMHKHESCTYFVTQFL